MAKKNISSNTLEEAPVTTTTQETAPVAVEPVVEAAIEPEPEAALAVPDWQDALPKPIRQLFEVMSAPEEGELDAMVVSLPEQDQEAFNSMIDNLNPVREGFVSARADFKIPLAKLYHGVGDDPARPATAPVGSVYTSDGLVLAAFNEAQARSLKIGKTFKAAILQVLQTRQLRPSNDRSNVPPDMNPNSKAPICYSLDRVRGSRYGGCAACPHRPYANGKWAPDSCTDEVRIYFVLHGFKGIYALTVKGQSLKKAVEPIRRQKGRPWDVWFDLGVAEERNDKGRWFSLTATPHVTDDAPQGAPTTAAERGVLRTLARLVLHEAYAPELRSVYDRPTKGALPVLNAQADMAAMMAAAGALPDYSKNNL